MVMVVGVVASAILLSSSLAMPLAFAQPYNAGYISGTPSAKNGFQMKTTTLSAASGRSSFLASLISAAGFVSSSSTDPTGWVYQTAANLGTDNYIRQGINVRFLNQCRACPSSPQIIGHNGTASTDVKYAYVNMFWSGTPSTICR
jgi:hypothetical protein